MNGIISPPYLVYYCLEKWVEYDVFYVSGENAVQNYVLILNMVH